MFNIVSFLAAVAAIAVTCVSADRGLQASHPGSIFSTNPQAGSFCSSKFSTVPCTWTTTTTYTSTVLISASTPDFTYSTTAFTTTESTSVSIPSLTTGYPPITTSDSSSVQESTTTSDSSSALEPTTTFTIPPDSTSTTASSLGPTSPSDSSSTLTSISDSASDSTSATASTDESTIATGTTTATTTLDATTITITTGTDTTTVYTATSTICTVNGNAPRNYRRSLGRNVLARGFFSLSYRPQGTPMFAKKVGRFRRQDSTTTLIPSATFTPTAATSSDINSKPSFLSSPFGQSSTFTNTACSCVETSPSCVTLTSSATTITTIFVTATGPPTGYLAARADTTDTITVQATVTATISATSTVSAATSTSTGCLAGCSNGDLTGSTFACTFINTCDQTVTSSSDDGETTIAAVSLSDCLNACDADGNCNVYSYDGVSQTCTLYANSVSMSTDPALGSAYGIYAGSCSG